MTTAIARVPVFREATPAQRVLRRLKRRRGAMIGLGVVVFFVVVALLAPWIAPHDPFDLRTVNLLDSHNPPAWMQGGDARFLLGTDDQGRDVLSTILYGSRLSLAVGALSVAFAAALGIALGLIAGYFGGWIDGLIMRIADVQLTFPAILTALLIDGTVRALA